MVATGIIITQADVDAVRGRWRQVVPEQYSTLLEADWLERPGHHKPESVRLSAGADGTAVRGVQFNFWTRRRREGGGDIPAPPIIPDQPSRFWWDEARQVYVFKSNGAVVTKKAVGSLIDTYANVASPLAKDAARALIAGEIDVFSFETEMRALIKEVHLSAAVAAEGGWNNLTHSDWGYSGYKIRTQYDALTSMIDGIIDGRVPINGRIEVASDAFMKKAFATYSDMTRRSASRSGEFNEEIRIAQPGACDGCAEVADAWVPIGTLPGIGDIGDCYQNCRCEFDYRWSAEVDVIGPGGDNAWDDF